MGDQLEQGLTEILAAYDQRRNAEVEDRHRREEDEKDQRSMFLDLRKRVIDPLFARTKQRLLERGHVADVSNATSDVASLKFGPKGTKLVSRESHGVEVHAGPGGTVVIHVFAGTAGSNVARPPTMCQESIAGFSEARLDPHIVEALRAAFSK
jgi:hypothetical protein